MASACVASSGLRRVVRTQIDLLSRSIAHPSRPPAVGSGAIYPEAVPPHRDRGKMFPKQIENG
jgi:hypothetical protein